MSPEALLGSGPDDYQMSQIEHAADACGSLTVLLVGLQQLEVGDYEAESILRDAALRMAEHESSFLQEDQS